jgi:hypothetical protein
VDAGTVRRTTAAAADAQGESMLQHMDNCMSIQSLLTLITYHVPQRENASLQNELDELRLSLAHMEFLEQTTRPQPAAEYNREYVSTRQ